MELPEPPLVLPELEPEPMLPLLEPPLDPVLGELDGLGEELELEPPLVPPLAAPEPDLLKCASHSEREMFPSLFVSTDEKLGAELELLEPDRPPPEPPEAALPPDVALPPEDDVPDEPLDMPEEPPELEPEAAGADDLSLDELEELCARAAPERASMAAAVAALRSLRLNMR